MGRRCFVRGCLFKYYPPIGGCIHKFPDDPTVQKLWMILSGSEDGLSLSSIGVCSHHFSVSNYKVEDSDNKKRLLKVHAIPDQNLPFNPQGSDYKYEVVVDLIKKLRAYEDCQMKIRYLEKQLSASQSELQDIKSNQNEVVLTKIKEHFGHIFTLNQIDLVVSHKKWKKWNDEDMAKAIAIYNQSSSCYQYLRDQLHYPLPSRSSVLRWASKIIVEPGLIKPVLAVIKEEFVNFSPMQRQAVLCFDEVSVDSRISLIERNQLILGPFKNMMAIYIRGLFCSWKQLIYFDFDLRLTSKLIHEIISALYAVGIKIVALVSDMSTINIRVWNELDIDIKKNKFSFPHPVTSENVWMFADFCHMLKLLRNHFIDHPIQLGEDFQNTIISKEMIEELLEYQKDDIQIAFKLSKRHIEMNKRERMNVRTAFELFSTTTAKAISFLFPQYKVAAEFFQLVNDFADIMNSHTNIIGTNPLKCPFGTCWNEQKIILDKFETNIAELRVQGGHRPVTKPFQKGFKLICGSLKGLFKQMQLSPVSCKYIMTSHLNQDFVESGFGTFRGIGGFNDLPLPGDAIFRVKTMIIAWNLKSPTTGNVLAQSGINFLSSRRLALMSTVQKEVEICGEIDEEFEAACSNIDPLDPVRIQLTSNTDKSKFAGMEYIAGFIAKVLMTEYPNLQLNSGTNQVGWVSYLSQGNPISPSKWWLEKFMKFDQYFNIFHKSRYYGELCLNRKPFVIDRLTKYLVKMFPMVPQKAVRFYVRLRTKIRVDVFNKKIALIRKKRRAQAYVNSVIVGEIDENEDTRNRHDEEPAEDIVNLPVDDNFENNLSRATSGTSYTPNLHNMEIDNIDDAEEMLTNIQNPEDFIQNEYDVIFDEELYYNPLDFDIFEDDEVLEALE